MLILALPLSIPGKLLPSRQELYPAVLWDNGAGQDSGPYAYTGHVIFDEKGPIDIAFLGASHTWMGIASRYVEEQLSKRLHRPAVVRSVCWMGPGFDALNLIGSDLLEHRKVGMIVVDDVYNSNDEAQNAMPAIARYGEDSKVFRSIPFRYQLEYYLAAVMGMPKKLLLLVRHNLPLMDSTSTETSEASRGAGVSLRNFGDRPASRNPFHRFVPQGEVPPSDILIYSKAAEGRFEFGKAPLSSWQLSFAKDWAHLASEKGTAVVVLTVPSMTEQSEKKVWERTYWPTAFGSNVSMIGVPAASLFRGMTDSQIKLLFSNSDHLNANGQAYFTKAICPKLLDIYETVEAKK